MVVFIMFCFPLPQLDFQLLGWDKKSTGYFMSCVVHQGWHGDCSLSNKQTIILKGTNSTTGSKWNLRVLRVWTHWMPAAEKSFLMAMWAIMIDRINIKFKCSIFARFICMHIKIHMKIYTICSIFLDCVVSPTKKSTHQELILKKKNFGGSFLLLFSFF